MSKYIAVAAVCMSVVLGCAGRAPVAPNPSPGQDVGLAVRAPQEGPYRLWGEWTWYIPESHDRVDVVPRRVGRFHLNALKFLEGDCTDCLKVLQIKNNGDGTVDITVRISHPFKGFPEYTGFDVKGIIMFNGSYEYPYFSVREPPYPDDYRISWRLLGDPELLNPDGFTLRWSPTWESGSDLPILNYWPGKHSNGTPTANLNGFINFYTHEERHMFITEGMAQRTFTVWLPPGEPVVAGYAVEACWVPPIRTPVTDPLDDFPPSANQPEPYLFNLVVNNDEPITVAPCCGGGLGDCSQMKVECAMWEGVNTGSGVNTYVYYLLPDGDYIGFGRLRNCSPAQEDFYYAGGRHLTEDYENGTYRELLRYCRPPTADYRDVVIDIYDFTVDIED